MSQHPPSQLQAMPPRLTAAELMAADLPARQTILDPLLATKSLALLYGPRGLGKTFMAMSIAWAVAGGGQFLNWRASRPHRVCYVDGEMPAVDMKERLRLLGAVPPSLSFLLADLNEKGIPDLGTPRDRFISSRAGASSPSCWYSTISPASSARGTTAPIAGATSRIC